MVGFKALTVTELRFARWPVDIPPAYITWGFGEWDRSEYSGWVWYQHRGIDIGCPVGTPVYAPAAGVVYDHQGDGSFGVNVAIDHPGTPWYSIYAHLSQALVGPGQAVEAGQLIALSGNTGLSSGPHVHWQVCRVSWFPRDIAQSADPASFLATAPQQGETWTMEHEERLAALEQRVATLQAFDTSVNAAVLARFAALRQIGAELFELATRITVTLDIAADPSHIPAQVDELEALAAAAMQAQPTIITGQENA